MIIPSKDISNICVLALAILVGVQSTMTVTTYTREALLDIGFQSITSPDDQAKLLSAITPPQCRPCINTWPTRRGTKAGQRVQRSIRPVIGRKSHGSVYKQTGCNPSNLVNLTSAYEMPTIVNTNAQSLVCKVDELSVFLKENNVDIACISETWLKDTVPDNAVNIDGFKVERTDRKEVMGGGVCCFLRYGTPYKVWHDLSDPDLETLWITLRPKRMPRQYSHITIGVVYLPPGCTGRPSKEKAMVRHIIHSLDTISRKHPNTGIFVVGDFNHMKDQQLKNFPLQQIVKDPTHGESILDCMYTNLSAYYNQPTTHPGLGLCRHSVVCCKPLAVTPNRSTVQTQSRKMTHDAKASFTQSLSQVDWTPLYRLQTCQEQYTYFEDTLQSLMDSHFPVKMVSRFSTDKPWITQTFKDLISKRQRALKLGNSDQYTSLRNEVNKTGKSLRAKYYKNQVEELKHSDSRSWWKKTKAIIGLDTSGNHQLQSLANEVCDGNMKDLAERVNTFFHSVSAELDPLDPTNAPDITQVPDQYIISQEIVEKKLLSTKLSKAPGPDGIPNWILRDLCGLISKPICSIFNASLREGVLPTVWKCANVTPIPKVSPPRHIESDLRPISLTPVLGKHLESIVGHWILEAISDNFDPFQYGGRKGLSTTHALVDMLHHWHQSIHAGKSVRVLLLDYSKAFDLVDHNILVQKFADLGTPPVLLKWLYGFLSNRKQRVKLGKDVSDWLSMNGAMPQGSWLGPLAFVVFISDMPLEQPVFAHKYMDDTTLSECYNNPDESHMQSATDQVVRWSDSNKMRVNTKKTKEMVISFKRPAQVPDPIVIEGNPLEQVHFFKLLGIWISDDLTWHYHANSICAKASPRLYFLRQLKRSGLSAADLTTFFVTVVRPVTEYGCPVWHSGLSVGDSSHLEQIQKRAMRIIYPELSYRCALQRAGLETLASRRDSLSRELFNAICEPSHKLNHLLPKTHVTGHNTRSNRKLRAPIIKTERFRKSFIMHSILNYQ